MPRVKSSSQRRKRKKKILKMAKGYYGARSKVYSVAKDAVWRAGAFAYRGRKEKKRNFRRLWITRINAASRILGVPYSKLAAWLSKANINIDRRTLADIAFHDPEAFAKIVEKAKQVAGDA